MPKKMYKHEEIIGKLREAEVRLSQGESVTEVVRVLQVSEVTYYIQMPQGVRRDAGRAG